MLTTLHGSISILLEGTFPSLFAGTKGVKLTFGVSNWTVDPMSADSVAGEPVATDRIDGFTFNPLAPGGPYNLNQTPFGKNRRVYLRLPSLELVALTPGELTWSADQMSLTVQPRARRELAGFDKLEVHYSVLAASTRIKTSHEGSLTFVADEPARAEQSLALGLAALTLNRAELRRSSGFSHANGNYLVEGEIKSVDFSRGTHDSSTSNDIVLRAEVDLKVTRFLGEDEGTPIRKIRSPGRSGAGKSVDIDPIVQN